MLHKFQLQFNHLSLSGKGSKTSANYGFPTGDYQNATQDCGNSFSGSCGGH